MPRLVSAEHGTTRGVTTGLSGDISGLGTKSASTNSCDAEVSVAVKIQHPDTMVACQHNDLSTSLNFTEEPTSCGECNKAVVPFILCIVE